MKYYLYLDDSNKFEKKQDKFVLYSFLLFSKAQRLKNESEFLFKFSLVKDFLKPFDLKSTNLSKQDILYGPLKEGFYKGHDLICRYNRALKNFEKYKKNFYEEESKNIENLLLTFKNATYIGTLYWCKECSVNKNFSDYNQIKNKKKYMLLIIVKKLLDNGILQKNDKLNIYLDEEFNDESKNILGQYFREYLNEPVSEYGNYQNKMKVKLRENNIEVKNLEFLDSEISIPIRMADFIANFSNKLLKTKANWVTDSTNVLNFFKTNNIEINYFFFPGFRYNKDVSIAKCAHY